MRLECVGFCGVDDSVDLEELCKISESHPWIEWGVLLRPDRQGTPRYAGPKVLENLGGLAQGGKLRLAVHLCGEDCLAALRGDVARVQQLHEHLGFRRMQINPTAANAASGWEPGTAADGLRTVAAALPDVELILQVNEETRALTRRLFEDPAKAAPQNFAALLDASCGLGVAPATHPAPLPGVHCGYAGGIGPDTVEAQLLKVAAACEGQCDKVWIDMESGVRSLGENGQDIFDLARVKRVLTTLLSSGHLLKDGA